MSLNPREVLLRAKALKTKWGPVTRVDMVRSDILEPVRRASELLHESGYDLDRAIARARQIEALGLVAVAAEEKA